MKSDMKSHSKFIVCTASILLGVNAIAQQATGAYANEQAQAGRDLYARNCSACHLPTLAGAGNAPPLAGAGFLANWRGKPASELYGRVRATMPPGGNPALTE